MFLYNRIGQRIFGVPERDEQVDNIRVANDETFSELGGGEWACM